MIQLLLPPHGQCLARFHFFCLGIFLDPFVKAHQSLEKWIAFRILIGGTFVLHKVEFHKQMTHDSLLG